MKTMNLNEQVWRYLKNSGTAKTYKEVGAATGKNPASCSSVLSDMVCRGMVEQSQSKYISGDTARTCTINRYRALGERFEVKPIKFAPVVARARRRNVSTVSQAMDQMASIAAHLARPIVSEPPPHQPPLIEAAKEIVVDSKLISPPRFDPLTLSVRDFMVMRKQMNEIAESFQ